MRYESHSLTLWSTQDRYQRPQMGREYLDSTLEFSNETYRVPDNNVMYHRYRQMGRTHLSLMSSSNVMALVQYSPPQDEHHRLQTSEGASSQRPSTAMRASITSTVSPCPSGTNSGIINYLLVNVVLAQGDRAGCRVTSQPFRAQVQTRQSPEGEGLYQCQHNLR